MNLIGNDDCDIQIIDIIIKNNDILTLIRLSHINKLYKNYIYKILPEIVKSMGGGATIFALNLFHYREIHLLKHVMNIIMTSHIDKDPYDTLTNFVDFGNIHQTNDYFELLPSDYTSIIFVHKLVTKSIEIKEGTFCSDIGQLKNILVASRNTKHHDVSNYIVEIWNKNRNFYFKLYGWTDKTCLEMDDLVL